ncbi:MAG: adenylate/guanylate cyclase domain-containing protein [Bacteroidetes bacterium]|nr:adenylate/guanylate cyclase domain-containing protein [Bacteroidota bacterium]
MLSRIGAIGYHPDDNEEVKMQKTLLVATAGTMGPMGFLWGGIYLYFNEPLAASIPLSYGVASLVSLAIFSQVKSYRIFRFSQLSFILLLPFLLMLALGGYVNSSAVVVWSFASPLGALVFMERTKALYWFAAYLGLVLAGVYFERYFPASNNLSEKAIIGFFVMNISGMSVVVFLLVYYFVGEKNLVLRLLEKKHRWIKEAFSAYVSPNLVEHLLRHPEELKLGGERRECTFVFTDLAGFTPLVEESDPATIVSLLNEYIEEMTKIVFRYEGTIDKIVGDGIAVLFSAPVYQKDHAQRGVECALEMDRFTEIFSKTKQQEGIALGQTRIGVNTGTVIIGNVGSMSQFNYSAIGDAVNTTSRLEGANKYLGTRICVSRSTVEKCPDIPFRPIGSLLLQGKTQAVEAFEPIDPDEANSDRINDYRAAFRLLEKNDEGALNAFAELQNSYVDDALVAFHLERLRSGATGSQIVLEGK